MLLEMLLGGAIGAVAGAVCANLQMCIRDRYLGDVQHIYRWQERYALAVAEIGSKLNCTILNLRDAFLVARDFKALLCVDGIHPSEKGHQLIWSEISRLIAGAQA